MAIPVVGCFVELANEQPAGRSCTFNHWSEVKSVASSLAGQLFLGGREYLVTIATLKLVDAAAILATPIRLTNIFYAAPVGGRWSNIHKDDSTVHLMFMYGVSNVMFMRGKLL